MRKAPAGKHPFGSQEGLELEFKEAAQALPKNFFETVGAFLNLDGGLIILGVADDGIVTGVDADAVERIKADIANLSNNPEKLDPPHLLFPHAEQVNGKWIIKTQVPASSQVHQTGGMVFLRSEDGDYRIKGLNRIAGLVNRKLSFFTEQRVFPHLEMSDLRPDLFEKARRLMRGRTPQHPWADLSPEELLNIAGFVRKDLFTGKPGYTLATALMFGTDATIQSAAPGYKFDALVRRRDTERYDDRLIVRTNLIDAFDLLMGFVEKHLDDPFYLEGTTAISLRAHIFRELVANIIAHREYTSAAPATMMIYRDRVEFKNPNVPHYRGRIDPAHFTPYPKNPTICKFLIQIGRYEELGSGVRNVTHYLPFYVPGAAAPSFVDDDMFTVVIPLEAKAGLPARGEPGATPQVESESRLESRPESSTSPVPVQFQSLEIRILALLRKGAAPASILSKDLGQKRVSGQLKVVLNRLLADSLIEFTIPDKPNSRFQKYRLTEKGQQAQIVKPEKHERSDNG